MPRLPAEEAQPSERTGVMRGTRRRRGHLLASALAARPLALRHHPWRLSPFLVVEVEGVVGVIQSVDCHRRALAADLGAQRAAGWRGLRCRTLSSESLPV
jgi:hypothetical protein